MRAPKGLIVCAALGLAWASPCAVAQAGSSGGTASGGSAAGGTTSGGAAAEEAGSERPGEEALVLETVVRFVDAVAAGDVGALRQLLWVNENSPSQVQMRDLLMQLIVAQRRLEQAALQRYGVEGAAMAARFQYALTDRDRGALSGAVVFIDDPLQGPPAFRVLSARVYADTQPGPLRLRRDPNGPWRVVFDAFERGLNDDMRERRPYPFTRVLLERYQTTLRVIEETTERVRSGELASARAASTELTTRLVTTAQEYEAKILEIRRPWGRER